MHQSAPQNGSCVPVTWPRFSRAVDRLIDLIVGKGLADQRDMARYEKQLASAEARNKAVKAVVYESPSVANPARNPELQPLLERTKSARGPSPPEGSIRPHPVLGQTPQPPQDQYITPLGAPDISAADISEEQLARIYSQSSVWDPKKDPVPPMQQMEGFGRFRRSVHANADWQLRRFRGDLQALGPAAMKQLGDFEIAGLKDGVMDNIIRETSSCTSLNSHSDSGDSSTGTRICKGFKPSHTRSKSMNDAKTGNTTPMPTKSKSATLRRPRRCSFLRDDDDSAPAPLPTIEESAPTPQTKKTVPLIFDAQGGADKVIDTDEYETCDDSYSPTNDDQMFAARALAQQMARIERVPKILRQRYVGYHPSWDIIPYKPHAYPKKKPVTRRLSSRCGGCM